MCAIEHRWIVVGTYSKCLDQAIADCRTCVPRRSEYTEARLLIASSGSLIPHASDSLIGLHRLRKKTGPIGPPAEIKPGGRIIASAATCCLPVGQLLTSLSIIHFSRQKKAGIKPALFTQHLLLGATVSLEAEGSLSEQVLTQGVVETSDRVGVGRQRTTNQRRLFVKHVVDTNSSSESPRKRTSR